MAQLAQYRAAQKEKFLKDKADEEAKKNAAVD